MFCSLISSFRRETVAVKIFYIYSIMSNQIIFFGIAFWLLWEAYFVYENQKSNSIILNLLLMAILIFLNFFLSFCILVVSYSFCQKIIEKVYLEKFQGIKINRLDIDDNFCKMDSEAKKRYILTKT